jgi:hypothetical protein
LVTGNVKPLKEEVSVKVKFFFYVVLFKNIYYDGSSFF